ncbi:MAG: cysteine--tRNA ligase [Candidatus Dormibacteraeota bacterium]|nr:cysteine--tRNA ligase [Candidatus Dormibacteraeota bacterium]
MRVFDTARQAVVPFEPHAERAGIYVCGITPYEAAHLGHAFTYHVFDVVARRLEASGLSVRTVRNVTDVDDDILRVARERGVDFRALADEQVHRFDSDMRGIGLLEVNAAPRATEHVPEMVRFVARLVESGFAYISDGWVYFDTRALPDYGRLSRLTEPEMIDLSRERGGNPEDTRKRHPLDFVLWQRSAPDEPHWPSPWSDGRPGWHIECSVLSTADLGVPIDVHGGGDDLIFPHHESELAQAEAGGVAPFVRHWVHVAMVRHEGEKMSKSLGNLVFVRDLLHRVPGATVRLLLAAHHYRATWQFEEHELQHADARRRVYQEAAASMSALERTEANALRDEFMDRIDDDLDTPGALRIVDLAATALGHSDGSMTSDAVSADELITGMLDILGVRVTSAVA